MRVGIVGCGRIAYRHVEALMRAGDFTIQWVYDIKKDMADAMVSFISEHYGYMPVPFTSPDVQHVDVVAITTPNAFHLLSLKQFYDRADIFVVEKPVVMNTAEWNDILKLSNDKKIYVSHQLRYLPVYQYVKSLIDSGKLGKISHIGVHMWWNRNKEYFQSAPWRGTWQYDGGMLFNQGIHLLDLGVFLKDASVDSVNVITANKLHDYIEADDVALGYVTFSDGHLLSIEATISAQPQNVRSEIAVFGEMGTIVINNHNISYFYVDGIDEHPVFESVPSYYGHQKLYENIKRGEGITLPDISTTMDILFDIYRR